MKNSFVKTMGSGTQIFVLLFLFFIGLFLLSIISAFILMSSGTMDLNALSVNTLKIIQTIQGICIFLLPALTLAYQFQEKPEKFLTLRSSFSILHGFLIVGIIVCIQPFINWLGDINNQIVFPESLSGLEQMVKSAENSATKMTERFLSDHSIWGFVTALIVVAAVAAICEEFFFRGVMQQLFAKVTKNIHLAVWITAIIFSAVHFQFYGFFPRIILGAVLGYIFVWTGSIWASVLVHFINNAVVVVYTYYFENTPIDKSIENFYNSHEALFIISFSIITLVLFYFLNHTKTLQTKEIIS